MHPYHLDLLGSSIQSQPEHLHRSRLAARSPVFFRSRER